MGKGERHPVRTIMRICAAVLVVLALTVAGYVVYLNVNYTRIADGIEVPNEGVEAGPLPSPRMSRTRR